MLEDGINALTKTPEIRRNMLGDGHPRTMKLFTDIQVFKRQKNAMALNEQGLGMKARGDSAKAMQLFQEANVFTMKRIVFMPI